MRAVDTTRNRPRRWSPTRALLWKRWRATWGFLALALLMIVGNCVWYLAVKAMSPGGFLHFAVSAPLTITIVSMSFTSSMALPVHRLRLPVSNAHLAFASYVYALVWPLLAFAGLMPMMGGPLAAGRFASIPPEWYD